MCVFVNKRSHLEKRMGRYRSNGPKTVYLPNNANVNKLVKYAIPAVVSSIGAKMFGGRTILQQSRRRRPVGGYGPSARKRYFGKFTKRGALMRRSYGKRNKRMLKRMKKRAITPYKALMGLRGTVAPIKYIREKHIEYTGSTNR